MDRYDHIIIGSGINSLVCAALLAKKGGSVLVLERNAVAGGCIRTEEITDPGFHHDVFSGFHPLFVTSPGYAELAGDLHERGLDYVNTECPTGVILPDGRHLILRTAREDNVRTLNAAADGDGTKYALAMEAFEQSLDLTFGLLGSELWRWPTAKMLLGQARRMGVRGMADYFGTAMQPCRRWLEETFDSDLSRAVFAPWILHTGLGPEAALSGHMAKLIAFTLEAAGMPIVKGGSARLVEAFTRLIEDHGGALELGADVESIITRDGAARGVALADGREITAGKSVIANVTPTQLYGRLLPDAMVPGKIAEQARHYRYGRGDMQIHIALDSPPDWRDPALAEVAMLHLTPGLDGVSRAVNEAERGLLPGEGTVVVAQPTALDPSRAPDGKAILWIQLQELPPVIKGDAAGEIDCPEDGRWTAAVRDAYAERILGRIERHAPGLRGKILSWRAYSPADLEAENINLVGGDPYSGACSLDQFFLWRPLRATKNHETPVKNLYHIGASTHPGPGLGGLSGYMVAKRL